MNMKKYIHQNLDGPASLRLRARSDEYCVITLPGADSFRCNRKKKRNGHYVTPISLYIAYIRRKSKVENLRFSPFLFEFFLSIAVSSLRRMYIRLSVGERRFPLEINLAPKGASH